MRNIKLKILNTILTIIVTYNKRCKQCEFRHPNGTTCFCFFSYECLKNNHKIFKEKF